MYLYYILNRSLIHSTLDMESFHLGFFFSQKENTQAEDRIKGRNCFMREYATKLLDYFFQDV